MANSTTVDELRDIKPLVEIADFSIYIYLSLWILTFVAVGVLAYWAIKKYRETRKINIEKVYLEKMDNIEWSNSKSASYEATEYGRYLANDERRKSIYQDMVAGLEKYKYREDNLEMESDDKRLFELYLKVCRESV